MDNYILNIKTVQAGAFRILIEALKEILTDGKNCLVVNNFNINNWIKKINKVKIETSKHNKIKRFCRIIIR